MAPGLLAAAPYSVAHFRKLHAPPTVPLPSTRLARDSALLGDLFALFSGHDGLYIRTSAWPPYHCPAASTVGAGESLPLPPLLVVSPEVLWTEHRVCLAVLLPIVRAQLRVRAVVCRCVHYAFGQVWHALCRAVRGVLGEVAGLLGRLELAYRLGHDVALARAWWTAVGGSDSSVMRGDRCSVTEWVGLPCDAVGAADPGVGQLCARLAGQLGTGPLLLEPVPLRSARQTRTDPTAAPARPNEGSEHRNHPFPWLLGPTDCGTSEVGYGIWSVADGDKATPPSSSLGPRLPPLLQLADLCGVLGRVCAVLPVLDWVLTDLTGGWDRHRLPAHLSADGSAWTLPAGYDPLLYGDACGRPTGVVAALPERSGPVLCGGALLRRLDWHRLQRFSGDPTAVALLDRLLERASAPYRRILAHALTWGTFSDPWGEFLVAYRAPRRPNPPDHPASGQRPESRGSGGGGGGKDEGTRHPSFRHSQQRYWETCFTFRPGTLPRDLFRFDAGIQQVGPSSREQYAQRIQHLLARRQRLAQKAQKGVGGPTEVGTDATAAAQLLSRQARDIYRAFAESNAAWFLPALVSASSSLVSTSRSDRTENAHPAGPAVQTPARPRSDADGLEREMISEVPRPLPSPTPVARLGRRVGALVGQATLVSTASAAEAVVARPPPGLWLDRWSMLILSTVRAAHLIQLCSTGQRGAAAAGGEALSSPAEAVLARWTGRRPYASCVAVPYCRSDGDYEAFLARTHRLVTTRLMRALDETLALGAQLDAVAAVLLPGSCGSDAWLAHLVAPETLQDGLDPAASSSGILAPAFLMASAPPAPLMAPFQAALAAVAWPAVPASERPQKPLRTPTGAPQVYVEELPASLPSQLRGILWRRSPASSAASAASRGKAGGGGSAGPPKLPNLDAPLDRVVPGCAVPFPATIFLDGPALFKYRCLFHQRATLWAVQAVLARALGRLGRCFAQLGTAALAPTQRAFQYCGPVLRAARTLLLVLQTWHGHLVHTVLRANWAAFRAQLRERSAAHAPRAAAAAGPELGSPANLAFEATVFCHGDVLDTMLAQAMLTMAELYALVVRLTHAVRGAAAALDAWAGRLERLGGRLGHVWRATLGAASPAAQYAALVPARLAASVPQPHPISASLGDQHRSQQTKRTDKTGRPSEPAVLSTVAGREAEAGPAFPQQLPGGSVRDLCDQTHALLLGKGSSSRRRSARSAQEATEQGQCGGEGGPRQQAAQVCRQLATALTSWAHQAPDARPPDPLDCLRGQDPQELRLSQLAPTDTEVRQYALSKRARLTRRKAKAKVGKPTKARPAGADRRGRAPADREGHEAGSAPFRTARQARQRAWTVLVLAALGVARPERPHRSRRSTRGRSVSQPVDTAIGCNWPTEAVRDAWLQDARALGQEWVREGGTLQTLAHALRAAVKWRAALAKTASGGPSGRALTALAAELEQGTWHTGMAHPSYLAVFHAQR